MKQAKVLEDKDQHYRKMIKELEGKTKQTQEEMEELRKQVVIKEKQCKKYEEVLRERNQYYEGKFN